MINNPSLLSVFPVDIVVFQQFQIALALFLTETPARLPYRDSRHSTVGGAQGRIWGQWDAPPLEFMKIA